jgi:4-carboxymuconolactone decarboxylase
VKLALLCHAAAALVVALPTSSWSQPTAVTEPRVQRGIEVLDRLNRGKPQPVFEAMRQEFPFLADATAAYALGDVWGRQVLDARTRQLAASAAFASLGLRGFFKTHAGYALDAGVTPDELKEVVYLITVPAGFPRAIEASQTLQELLDERGLSQRSRR